MAPPSICSTNVHQYIVLAKCTKSTRQSGPAKCFAVNNVMRFVLAKQTLLWDANCFVMSFASRIRKSANMAIHDQVPLPAVDFDDGQVIQLVNGHEQCTRLRR